jgi:peptidoglycan/LPS O-acetylase OafA/YrhL
MFAYRQFRRSLSSWISWQLDDQQEKGTIASLDGARATACLVVVGYHIALITRDMHLWTTAGKPLMSAIFLAGGYGVTLFFVLSGFLLFLPYARALLFKRRWPGTGLFYLRRALRIIPGYYFSLFILLMFANPALLEPKHWRQLILFPIFLQDSTQATNQLINGPYWTLAIEGQFYLLLPIIAFAIRLLIKRVSPSYQIWCTGACLLALMSWGLLSRALGDYLTAYPSITFAGIPRNILNRVLLITYGSRGKYLEDFAMGMLIALIYTQASNTLIGKKRLHKLSPWLWRSGIIILLFACLEWYPYQWPILSNLPHLLSWQYELSFSLGFGCCLLALLSDTGRLHKVFSWTLLRWFGLISYGVYIWHLPLLLVFMSHFGPHINRLHLHPYLMYSLYWLWVAIIIIPFSFVIFVCIERPAIRLSERIRQRRTIRQSLSDSGTLENEKPLSVVENRI